MDKIAVLYMCTGKYAIFWKDFYKSSEQFFLQDCKKEYFVFTDVDKLWGEEKCSRIHRIFQESFKWPLSTLKRFEIFLKIEERLKQFDYIFFFNANTQFVKVIQSEEFLPRRDELLVVKNIPFNEDPRNFPYDRNPQSLAYIPMGQGVHYYRGGVNGGGGGLI